MEKNKAAGPDKIPIEFYQCCWNIIKGDIIQLFADFHEGKVDIARLNYGIITLPLKHLMLQEFNNLDQYVFSIACIS
jgi:hypothetical protein